MCGQKKKSSKKKKNTQGCVQYNPALKKKKTRPGNIEEKRMIKRRIAKQISAEEYRRKCEQTPVGTPLCVTAPSITFLRDKYQTTTSDWTKKDKNDDKNSDIHHMGTP